MNGPRDIRAVLFDIDDTLVDFRSSAAAGLAHLLGAHAAREGLTPFWNELTERHYPRFLTGEVSFVQMQLDRLVELLAWAGLPTPDRDGLQQLEASRQQAMQDNIRLFDDVLPCLAALPPRRIGAVSNSDGPHQRAKLARVGLGDAFEVVVISGDLGIAKPDPQIFLEACRRLALPPDQVAYVGDRFDIDANAAAAAGLLGIWLDRDDRRDGSELAAGVVAVRSLAELPALLSSLSPADSAVSSPRR